MFILSFVRKTFEFLLRDNDQMQPSVCQPCWVLCKQHQIPLIMHEQHYGTPNPNTTQNAWGRAVTKKYPVRCLYVCDNCIWIEINFVRQLVNQPTNSVVKRNNQCGAALLTTPPAKVSPRLWQFVNYGCLRRLHTKRVVDKSGVK